MIEIDWKRWIAVLRCDRHSGVDRCHRRPVVLGIDRVQAIVVGAAVGAAVAAPFAFAEALRK